MNDRKFQIQLQRYPAISDLQARAKKRIPHVAWEYLSAGTGDDRARVRNLEALANVTLTPRFMRGKLSPNVETTLLGQRYRAPFGVAPVGLAGLIWPQVECILAKTANKYQFPFCLSTVATETPETIGPLSGDMAWFQLYPPRDNELRADLLQRIWDNGFRTLVVTADVPAPSRRERMSRAGLRMPPQMTPRFIAQGVMHPRWSLATVRRGLPHLRSLDKYSEEKGMTGISNFVRQHIGGVLSWEYLQEVRDLWKGHLVIKGVLHPEDAEKSVLLGVDAIQVSNHGARQFNGTQSAIEALPAIVQQVDGRAAILFDSGVRSGLDVIRALALGADFVFMGRAFMFGVAAFGDSGGDHVAEILLADLMSDMHQLGVESIDEIKALETD